MLALLCSQFRQSVTSKQRQEASFCLQRAIDVFSIPLLTNLHGCSYCLKLTHSCVRKAHTYLLLLLPQVFQLSKATHIPWQVLHFPKLVALGPPIISSWPDSGSDLVYEKALLRNHVLKSAHRMLHVAFPIPDSFTLSIS